MKVLVTGGTGFIGSRLVSRLAKEGMEVTVPVRRGGMRPYPPSGLITEKKADLSSPAGLEDLFEGVETVFHLAAIRGSGWAFSNDEVERVNVGMTRNILGASISRGVKRFIHVSSASVYGHPKGGPIDEDYPPSPVTRYGVSKYRSERLLEEFRGEEGLESTIIRPVITYGPGDGYGMVAKLASLIGTGRYLTVGDGQNRVHLIYVDDLVEGLMKAMDKGAHGGRIYILAGREPVRINRLVEIISLLLGRNVPRLHVPLGLARMCGSIMESAYRLCSVKAEPFLTTDKLDIMCRDRIFSPDRSREELGFEAKTGYEEGLAMTMEWMRSAGLIKESGGDVT